MNKLTFFNIQRNLKNSNLALIALYMISIGGLIAGLLGLSIKSLLIFPMSFNDQLILIVSFFILFVITYTVNKITNNLHMEMKMLVSEKQSG